MTVPGLQISLRRGNKIIIYDAFVITHQVMIDIRARLILKKKYKALSYDTEKIFGINVS